MEEPAAGAADHGTEVVPSWVVDMEKMLGDTDRSEERERWNKHSIYRVPQWIKDMSKGNVYEPSVVSLGPLHHGDHKLRPMEEHKQRALRCLVKRSGKPLREFFAAVKEVKKKLQDAYEERPEENNFVKLMITDGCFLLELFRMYSSFGVEEKVDDGREEVNYDPDDPIFSKHGSLYMWHPIRYDMLRMENQLPLLLLQKLQAVVSGTSPREPAAGAADNGNEVEKARSSWVEDMKKMLRETDPLVESKRWSKHSIYRVPRWIKDMNKGNAYKPSVVSLGPLHHGDPELRPMEEHKRRALWYLVKRSGKPLEKFFAAVEDVAEQLQDAYEERFEGNNFVELMITDGCFLLEAMRMCSPGGVDFALKPDNDPVFGMHGFLYMWPSIRSDMLKMENQLPLLLLQRLRAVESGKSPQDKEINNSVLRILGLTPDGIDQLGLHPLHILHTNLTNGGRRSIPIPGAGRLEPMPSAAKLYEWGIHFKSAADSFLDVHFEGGVLSMSEISVDNHTETEFLNLMAFERLHVGAGNYVTAYAVFMDDIINTTRDVELLTRKGVIKNFLGSEEKVAKLFNTLNKGAVINEFSVLHDVKWQVDQHCKTRWNKWRANFKQNYCSSPWVFISLVAATILLAATLLQTVYTIIKK